MDHRKEIVSQLLDGAGLFRDTAAVCQMDISKAAKIISSAYARGGKILICGNGGSAADSQHIAAELVGRFMRERKALSAIALSTDTSILTAISNDYSFDAVFKRQIEAHGKEGDVLVAISTSGNSTNVIAAAIESRRIGLKVISLTGKGGGKLRSASDVCIMVPSNATARIQEVQIAIAHIICDLVERQVS